MRSLNTLGLLVVSFIAFGCGSSTPPPETPEPEATEEAAPAEPAAAAADAGSAAH